MNQFQGFHIIYIAVVEETLTLNDIPKYVDSADTTVIREPAEQGQTRRLFAITETQQLSMPSDRGFLCF